MPVLLLALVIVSLSCSPLHAFGTQGQKPFCAEEDRVSCARRLVAGEQWQAIADGFPPSARDPAELDFCRGIALARLQRWPEAKEAFEVGKKKAPYDKRFPLELAGVAFKMGLRQESKRQLKRALRLDPDDRYGRDFIATLYFLDDNLDAALKHWNRIGKPQIGRFEPDSSPHVDPVLLDRSFDFSPAGILTLGQLRASRAHLDFSRMFSTYRFELVPRPDDKFDLHFHFLEPGGWVNSTAGRLLYLFRDIPYQTVHLDLLNLNRSASTLESMFRWDAQKRRLFARFSSPLRQGSASRFHIWLDGRNENWEIPGNSVSPASTAFNLKRFELGAGIASVVNDRWGWEANLSVSDQRFAGPIQVAVDAPRLYAEGPALRYEMGVQHRLLVQPENRLTLDSFVAGQATKFLTEGAGRFAQLRGGIGMDWLPQSRGDDYRVSLSVRAGTTFGSAPVNELFELGVEQDNDLDLRGRPGTTDGRKGAGAIGASYVLMNCEMDKGIYNGGLWGIKAGPFLDVGRAFDDTGQFGPERWLWDPGIQSKVVLLRALTFALSYGWDVRSNKSAFFVTVRPGTGPRRARLIGQ